MDNSPPSTTTRWSTPAPAVAALLVGGIALLLCAVLLSTDATGRALMAIAGLMVTGFGAYAAIIRPRLALTTGDVPALAIRTIGGSTTLTPADVLRVRVLTLRRIGRRSGQLEIDFAVDNRSVDNVDNFGETANPRDDSDDLSRLAVFSRWDLGADIVEVAEEIGRAGFPVDDTR